MRDAAETAAAARAAGGSVLLEPCELTEAGRFAVFVDPEGAAVRAGSRPGTAARPSSTSTLAELQRPQRARHRRRTRVLRRRVPLGDSRAGSRQLHVGAARLRRLPREANPRDPGRHGVNGRARPLRKDRRQPQPHSRRRPARLAAVARTHNDGQPADTNRARSGTSPAAASSSVGSSDRSPDHRGNSSSIARVSGRVLWTVTVTTRPPGRSTRVISLRTRSRSPGSSRCRR